MIEQLSKIHLPADHLLRELVKTESLECTLKPFKKSCTNNITWDLVTHPKVIKAAQKYISILLKEKMRYGYTYFLNGQNMLIPLSVHFKSDLYIGCQDKDRVVDKLHRLASEFTCDQSTMHEITMVELLYFFIRLVNPDLSWIAVDNILHCFPWHAHLIALQATG